MLSLWVFIPVHGHAGESKDLANMKHFFTFFSPLCLVLSFGMAGCSERRLFEASFLTSYLAFFLRFV